MLLSSSSRFNFHSVEFVNCDDFARCDSSVKQFYRRQSSSVFQFVSAKQAEVNNVKDPTLNFQNVEEKKNLGRNQARSGDRSPLAK